jgi:adenine/guanine phosphoribosyltransferase-like PRPP-binding protein
LIAGTQIQNLKRKVEIPDVNPTGRFYYLIKSQIQTGEVVITVNRIRDALSRGGTVLLLKELIRRSESNTTCKCVVIREVSQKKKLP